MSRHFYTAFGLCFAFPFRSPVLQDACGQSVDVWVRLAPLEPLLAARALQAHRLQDGVQVQVGRDGTTLWRTGYGRFLAANGCEIVIDAEAGSDPGTLHRFLLYSCMPAIMAQRGCLVLHANAARTASGAVVVAGESGAGKSTWLATAVRSGARLIADDVSVIRSDDNGELVVLPAYPQYRLCADAAERMHLRAPGPSAVPPGVFAAKRLIHLECRDALSPAARVGRLFFLSVHDGEEIAVEEIRGLEKLAWLEGACLPPGTAGGALAFTGPLLRAAALPMFRVCRPRQRWTAAELTSLLLAET
ncbi:MAG: hypothetical protein HYV63_07825 [Candidatus Schekmanbacteria bacterium]|nr:hypothetical protein [Candidatus Schekmanbacteria bacterium]